MPPSDWKGLIKMTEDELERERDFAIVRTAISVIENDDGRARVLEALKRIYNKHVDLVKGK